MKKIIIIIICIIIILAIIGKNNKENENEILNNKIEEEIQINGIKIIKQNLRNGILEIVFKNNTGKEIKLVKITAECYDKNGYNLGKNTNGQYNINTTDNYKINIFSDYDTVKYKLEVEYE